MVTGHRPDKVGGYGSSRVQDAVRAWLRCRLRDAWAKHSGGVIAVSGGALGVDQWFAEEAIVLGIPFELYEPFIGFDFPWQRQARQQYASLRERAKRVVTVCPPGYTAAKMQRRNEAMVNVSQTILAVWDGSDGGTANCINYVHSVGREVDALLNPRDLK
ncbi:MAG: SLOG family protein [Dehalococcoidia bacterium]|nr:SLOG family protein [Dehalococcoidia bacterium]